ncbi:hypothetical protein FGO68_gene16420 [Halteria grandinella]|uniref:Cyclic nucleotide-binding domain-containing protein n=1 Tax=Halteria grandinella TaxID=5974 RepID=A0A8J8P4K6_HALGN|nr:hypothetical protein FGO68_gene16420 [Halteria grandinella]
MELYVTSFYFTVTTIMTVGYGDITARSLAEKLLCILLMLIGVISFSFATGAISSIITNQDTAEAKLKEKMQTLESIQAEYQIDKDLFNRIVKAVKYDHRQNSKDVHEFMEELPAKLRIDLAMAIHKKMYSNIKFFQDKDNNFIAWVGTFLRPINVQEKDYIYKEGEDITEVYFVVTGSAGYVLPRFNNKVYMNIVQGDHFGHVDLGSDKDYFKVKKTKMVKKRKRVPLHRKFTVQAQENCDLLTLTLEDLDKMNSEFPDICKQLLDDAMERIHTETKLKIDAFRECEMEAAKSKSDLRSKLSAIFLSGLHKTMREVGKDGVEEGGGPQYGHPGYGPNHRDSSMTKKKTMMERARYLQRNSKMNNQVQGLQSMSQNINNSNYQHKKVASDGHQVQHKSSIHTNDDQNDGGASMMGGHMGQAQSATNFLNDMGGSRVNFGESYAGANSQHHVRQGMTMQQQSLQKGKVSFKVESEIISEDDGDDLDGMSGHEGGHGHRGQPQNHSQMMQKSGMPFQSSPSVFGGNQDYNTDEEEEEDYGMEEIDSEISDENLLMFYEIRQAIIMLNKKTDKITTIVKQVREQQRYIGVQLQQQNTNPNATMSVIHNGD